MDLVSPDTDNAQNLSAMHLKQLQLNMNHRRWNYNVHFRTCTFLEQNWFHFLLVFLPDLVGQRVCQPKHDPWQFKRVFLKYFFYLFSRHFSSCLCLFPVFFLSFSRLFPRVWVSAKTRPVTILVFSHFSASSPAKYFRFAKIVPICWFHRKQKDILQISSSNIYKEKYIQCSVSINQMLTRRSWIQIEVNHR